MANQPVSTQRPAAHLKLRTQSNLVELLHRREEARLLFHDLDSKIKEQLSKVPGSVQDSFAAVERLYSLNLEGPPNEPSETNVPDKAIERLDELAKKEDKPAKKKPRHKSAKQKEKSKNRLQALKRKREEEKKQKGDESSSSSDADDETSSGEPGDEKSAKKTKKSSDSASSDSE